MKKYSLVLAALLFAAGCMATADTGMSRFVGSWSVDFERTMEEARKSPQVSAEEIDKMPAMIERLAAMMKLEVSESEVVYARGERKNAAPYTVKESSAAGTVVSFTMGDRSFDATFTAVDADHMNFRSSASNDMDLIIWKRD